MSQLHPHQERDKSFQRLHFTVSFFAGTQLKEPNMLLIRGHRVHLFWIFIAHLYCSRLKITEESFRCSKIVSRVAEEKQEINL